MCVRHLPLWTEGHRWAGLTEDLKGEWLGTEKTCLLWDILRYMCF